MIGKESTCRYLLKPFHHKITDDRVDWFDAMAALFDAERPPHRNLVRKDLVCINSKSDLTETMRRLGHVFAPNMKLDEKGFMMQDELIMSLTKNIIWLTFNMTQSFTTSIAQARGIL